MVKFTTAHRQREAIDVAAIGGIIMRAVDGFAPEQKAVKDGVVSDDENIDLGIFFGTLQAIGNRGNRFFRPYSRCARVSR